MAMSTSLRQILSNIEENIETLSRIHHNNPLSLLSTSLQLKPIFNVVRDLYSVVSDIHHNNTSGNLLSDLYSWLIKYERLYPDSATLAIIAKLFTDVAQPFFGWVNEWIGLNSQPNIIITDFESLDPYHEFFIYKNKKNEYEVRFIYLV